jgi:D-alanyl-D-alanine carboxypeptidase/D-alanyl-D-alanine-endopeptidase (penicillin-binding protein 4)
MRAFLLLSAAALAQGQDFAARVESLLAGFPAVARGAWGVKAVNLTTGETVYERNASSTFVPASNMKLYTTAFALTRLGPEHRFVTRVYVSSAPDGRGTVNGDLILAGGGDPSLSGREIPYRKNGAWADALGPLDALAAELAAQGVRRITGDVIGDDRAYVWEPFPPGWAQDDTLYEYGAPVSALTLHDNFVTVTLTPSAPGQLAHVRVVPETGYFQILSRVTTNGRGAARIDEERGGDPRTLRLSGSVSRASSLFLAVDDPARYAAHALRELLMRRGITVDGRAVARHRFAGEGAGADAEPGVKIAERASPPLSELVKVVNKVSQNLHAEILLREVARADGKAGSRREALDGLSSFLKGLGASSEDFALYDGSGLSRLTLVSPETTLRVLRYMHEGANRGIWLDSLPVGGEDGTLSARFQGFQDGAVRAKTGTLSHCTSLAGYLETSSGETIAFAMMANNANTNAAGIRGFFDKVVELLAASGKLQ